MKGSVFQFLIIMLFFIFIPSIILVVVTYSSTLLQNVTTSGTNPLYPANSQAAIQQQQVINVFPTFDYMIPFLYLGMNVAAIAFGAFIKSHPVNFILVWIILIFLTYISFYMSNILHLILSEPILVNSSAKYPTILGVDNELPFIQVFAVAIYSVVILLRYRAGDLFKTTEG